MKTVVTAIAALLAISTAAGADDWQPTEAQKTEALRTANSYFELIDKGRYDAAYAMQTPSTRATATKSQYVSFWQDNARRTGDLRYRRVLQVTWYLTDSPDGTAVAAAVDYEGAYEKSNIYCGYLALIETTGGTFQLLRDDLTLATSALLRKMPPVVRIQTFNRPGCRRFLADEE